MPLYEIKFQQMHIVLGMRTAIVVGEFNRTSVKSTTDDGHECM